MENTLSQWLESHGLSKYLEALLDNDIDSISLVATLSADDLKELGVSLGDRKRFGLAIEQFASTNPELSQDDLALVNSLPYVIAYPLKQTLLEKHAWTRINLFKDTFLNYLKYLGLLSASEFFSSELKDRGMVALFHQNLTETAFGKWNHYIREVLKFLKQHNHHFFCPELLAYYETIETGSKAVKYKGEIEFIDANGDLQLKKQEATAIGMLINFRNRYLGHGLTLDADASEKIWQEYFPIFRTLLEKMNFAQAYPMHKIEDGESWILHTAEITRTEYTGIKDENIWMQNPNGKYLSILPFFIVPGELAVANMDKAKVFAYESYTGKTIKFFSPEGTEKQTSGKILERLNLLLREKQKESPFSPEQFDKDTFLKRIGEENAILLDTLVSERKIISGVYQHREQMEIKLREWIGARANIFFIAAEAGSGKTNLLAEMQRQYTERGYPTLLIRAGRMEKTSLQAQVAYLLNIDASAGLHSYGAISGSQSEPTFILIDGLNEARESESIWREILDWSKSIDPGSIKFVITSRANSKADLERFALSEGEHDLLYGETKENEKGLDAHVFWLTPMDMKEMKGAWKNYTAKDKSRFKPMFSFDDLATFDRGLYDQISNPLILRLFLEVYNGKALPRKGGKHLHIWQDWFNTFSAEEQTFLRLLTDEVWLKGSNELLLDDLLQHEKLKPYISSDLVNSPYARMKNLGWLSRYMKDMNTCIGFTVEGSLLFLLGKKLQQQVPDIDVPDIKNVLSNGKKLQRSAIESFLCEQALVGDLSLVTALIDAEVEELDLCIQPLLLFLKTFGAAETVKLVLQNPTEQDWKAMLQLDTKISELQLHSLRIDFLKFVMPANPMKTKDELWICLKAIAVFDKELSISYYNQIDTNSSILKEDADLLNELGEFQHKFGNYNKALEFCEKSLTIRLNTLGDKHPLVATSYDNVGFIWDIKGEHDKALDFYEKSLTIRLKTLGGEHLLVATLYNNIGVAWKRKGENDKALEFFEKSFEIKIKTLGGEHPSVAISYNNIGLVWESKGDIDKALDFYEKSLIIRLKTFGDEHPSVAITYSNIGSMMDDKGEYERALVFYEKALKIELKTLGDEHPSLATSYNNIGLAWKNKGDIDKALEFYEKSLTIRLKTLGGEHPSVAISYNNIGLAWKDKGDIDKALEFYEKSFEIKVKTLGEEHSSVANTYNNIGMAWNSKGDFAQAFVYFLKCSSIRKNSLGLEHKSTQTSIARTKDMAQKCGRENELPDWMT